MSFWQKGVIIVSVIISDRTWSNPLTSFTTDLIAPGFKPCQAMSERCYIFHMVTWFIYPTKCAHKCAHNRATSYCNTNMEKLMCHLLSDF